MHAIGGTFPVHSLIRSLFGTPLKLSSFDQTAGEVVVITEKAANLGKPRSRVLSGLTLHSPTEPTVGLLALNISSGLLVIRHEHKSDDSQRAEAKTLCQR
jgi:hypothetical protein